MFGSGDSTTAGPTEHPGGEPASASQDRQRQMPMPLSGGRKPTPTIRSHCQHAGLERHRHCHRGRYQWSWWSLGDRDKLDDEDAGKQFVSVPPFHPRPSSYFPFFPSPSFFGYRVWSRAAKGGLSPTPFSSSPDTGCPLACRFHDDNRRSSFRSPCSLHLELLRDPSWKTRIHFYLFLILVLAHVPLQAFLRLQYYLHLDRVSRHGVPGGVGVCLLNRFYP